MEHNPIRIPSTLDGARERLAQIEGIITAKGWERAAIVWAFVDRPGSGPRVDRENPRTGISKISATDFAALGFAGLRSSETVAHYHKAWQEAIDTGKAKPVKPGDRVEVPDLEWPPRNKHLNEIHDQGQRDAVIEEAEAAGTSADQVARVRESGPAIAAAIKADPKIAQIAETALAERGPQVVVVRHMPKGEPIPSHENPVQRDLWQAMEALLCARDDARRAVRLVTGHGKLIGESAGLIEEPIANIRAALDLLDAYLTSGGITDVALEAWLAGDAK